MSFLSFQCPPPPTHTHTPHPFIYLFIYFLKCYAAGLLGSCNTLCVVTPLPSDAKHAQLLSNFDVKNYGEVSERKRE